ncbi:5-carboxymethyl-2-hydroxymuconate Delta-isomerase [Azospira restricta]|uniref:5-carboxymethyl-2-hydroxymuconate isomerase n=1 Tax=Azospira restricta TaxID=404405 RepID=A0A974PYQ8_9RHOO|nr:5-carboxymethyl-2-hydroxymuconate isomerase [Azospira restricta]QRJ63543.1 5-carboxymethyl-2-hydroxymuconate isomerase [Azospira restricta]
MPHLTLEYTDNLAPHLAPDILPRLNRALLASSLFAESDLKSRALLLDQWCVGVEAAPRAFAHVRVALLSGRPPGAKRALAEAVLAALADACAPPPGAELQLSVEIVDIDAASYAKEVRNGR